MHKMSVIRFYHEYDAYGFMSNFYGSPVLMLDPHTGTQRLFKTSEHYFQAMKFTDPRHFNAVCLTPTPGKSAQLGRSRAMPLRPDWESVKDQIMLDVCMAKFSQHSALKDQLLATGATVVTVPDATCSAKS